MAFTVEVSKIADLTAATVSSLSNRKSRVDAAASQKEHNTMQSLRWVFRNGVWRFAAKTIGILFGYEDSSDISLPLGRIHLFQMYLAAVNDKSLNSIFKL